MKTLLVVVADQTTLEGVLRPALPADVYEIEVSPSIEEASQVMAERSHEIDAILIDWAIPGLTRRAATLPAWVRQHAERDEVEVVVHARSFDPEHADQVMTSGAYYFLAKPFVPSQLRGIVRAAVTSCRLKREVAEVSGRLREAASLLREGHFRIRTLEEADALAAYLGATCSDPQQGIGFLELLRNAVEHGNLEISYDEKGRLLETRTLRDEIQRRLETSPFAERYADVFVKATERALEVDIIDQGPGFDFGRFLVMTPDRIFDNHGRGVLLASMCLEVEYFEPGNRVRAVARRAQPSEA